MIPIIIGIILILIALYIISLIEAAPIGKYTSRFLAVICAFLGYFYIIPKISRLKIKEISTPYINWSVTSILFILVIFYIYKIYKNWQEEMKFIIKNSWKLILVIILFAFSRIFFSL